MWREPVINRGLSSRTTAEDMNRIVDNIEYLGGVPVKTGYENTDIVTEAEWNYIISFARRIDASITSETTYNNLNKIELSLLQLYDASNLAPSESLLPSETLYPNKEVMAYGLHENRMAR